jgi:hypothetical protein
MTSFGGTQGEGNVEESKLPNVRLTIPIKQDAAFPNQGASGIPPSPTRENPAAVSFIPLQFMEENND